MIVSGGVGIAKSLFIGGDMSVAGTLTYEDVTNTETAGITTTGGLVVTGLGATFGSGVGIADSIYHIGDDNTAIRFPAADTFTVETAGSEAIRVSSGGSFGIGTNNPDRMLSVSDTTNGKLARFIGPSNNLFIMNDRSGIIDLNSSGTGDHLCLGTQDTERVRITSDGLVGINTASPNATLEVASTGTATLNIVADTNNDGAANDSLINFRTNVNSGTASAVIKYDESQTNFGIETNGTRALSIDTSQRLLIGTTNTRGTHGGGDAQLQIEGTNTATAGMSITRTSADTGSPTFSFGKTRNGSALSDGDDVGVIYWQGDDGTDLAGSLFY